MVDRAEEEVFAAERRVRPAPDLSGSVELF
jgi:hypothetical protein